MVAALLPLAYQKRQPGFGVAYALSAQKLAYADPGGLRLGVDEKSMSATFCVTDETPDRVGDVVVAKGIDISNFKNNPIWFFNHQMWPLPIGTSQAPNGKLAVTIEPKRALATCFFSQKSKEAEQVFSLVVEDILRCCSIGFNPLAEPVPRGRGEANPNSIESGLRFPAIDLLEISIVGVPANPQATLLRSHLSKGLIAGMPIADKLRKSLEPYAEGKPVWVKSGYDAGALARAKAADLVTLPAKDKGTICGNCEYVTTKEGRDYCKNEKVDQVLADGKDRMCCALWDAPGTKRAWQEGDKKMSKKYGKAKPVPARRKEIVEKIIRHEGDKWVLYSHEGKVLGRHDSEEDAKKQEAAIEAHKHGDKAMLEGSGTEGGYAVPEGEEKAEGSVQECVHNKIPKIADDHPEMKPDQREAVAFSMCGEGKKAFPPAGAEEEEGDEEEPAEEEGSEEESAEEPTAEESPAEEEGAEEEPAAEGAEEAPAAEAEPTAEGKPEANAPAKPDAAGQPPFGAAEAATPAEDTANEPQSAYQPDLTDERRPGGVQLFQRLIEDAESELGALEPEAKVAAEQAIEALRRIAEQRYPEEDFGGVEPEEVSPTGSVAQPNPAEEAEEAAITQNILDRYKDHRPSQQKCSGGGAMSKYQKSKRYMAAIVKAAADHMHGFRKLIGKKYGEDEHEETHDHARALDHLHGVLTKGEPDDDEDEREEYEEHEEHGHDDHDDDDDRSERDSFAPADERHPYEHKDVEEEEKGIDWSAISEALKPLREQLDRNGNSLLYITGKN